MERTHISISQSFLQSQWAHRLLWMPMQHSINTRLGVSSYKIVDTSNGEKTDSTYFKSEFSSLDEVIEAKDALAAEIASEGTVLFKNEDTTLPLNTSSDKVTLWGLNSINPTLGGMIGSSVSIDAEAGQKQYDIQTALTEKGFSLNQDMLDLYSSRGCKWYIWQKRRTFLTAIFWNNV